MRIVLSLGIPMVILAAWTAATGAEEAKPKQRTSPVGYDDTPVLPGQKWRVHDIKRPAPPPVTPGRPGEPPSDAIVLFNGKSLDQWVSIGKGGNVTPPTWKVQDGYMEMVTGGGDLVSKEKFGDCQIHVEWAAPPQIDGTSQWRGNSGILLMHRYEIQVLDSWNNPTYADGQAAAIYGQYPPLVNASRKPGEWQTYDIAFEAPRFEGDKLTKPAYVTVFHNGVLMHHHQEIMGGMQHRKLPVYAAHAAEEPLALQNHDTKTRYRSVW
ncbi:MAG TPA: DUF1080 domain-containing protein, partial [Bryobacteraceae bacterium]|nr:DUF1080 domain-containing protein [Bryobacteraceae bacterium]